MSLRRALANKSLSRPGVLLPPLWSSTPAMEGCAMEAGPFAHLLTVSQVSDLVVQMHGESVVALPAATLWAYRPPQDPRTTNRLSAATDR